MKVLVLATDLFTRGGIARYTWTLASALGRELGSENVDVLAFFSWGDEGKKAEEFGYLGAVTGRQSGSLLSQGSYLARAIGAGRRKYDLVIANHIALAPVARILKFIYGTPYWVTCHSIEVWWGATRMRASALRHADLVLPISEYTARVVERNFRIDGERVRVLYNAVPDEFVRLLKAADDAGVDAGISRGAEADEKVILSVTTLVKGNEFKGIDTVIRAMPKIAAAIPKVRYVVVGAGEIRKELESLAAETGLAGRVTFAGEVSDAELAAWYRRCDVFVLPSRGQEGNGEVGGEGFGRVYVEAALAGKTVIASRTGGAAEAVLHGKTGLSVDPTSSDEVAEVVIAILQNGELGERMGAEGRRWAMGRFSEEALRNSLQVLLRESGAVEEVAKSAEQGDAAQRDLVQAGASRDRGSSVGRA